jgi:hypothetical protein
MTDRKLLELAAKAAGLPIVGDVDRIICQPDHRTGGYVIRNDRGGDSCWNPLTDDGDALRLAVKLEMCVSLEGHGRAVAITVAGLEVEETNRDDPYAAARRAIVRAAAEIGRSIK